MPLRRFGPFGRPAHRLSFLGAALILLSVACLLLGTSIARQIDDQAVAPSDASIFSIMQIEVEFLKFDRALRDAAAGQGDLDEVRLWFDIFYSRVMPTETTRTLAHYLDAGEFMEPFEEVRDFARAVLPMIDAPDAQLREALPTLVTLAAAIEPSIRDSALTGVSTTFARSHALWEGVQNSLRVSARFLGAAVAGLVLLAASLLVLFRITENRAREIEAQVGRMRTIVETSLDAIFVLDARGRIRMINEVAQGLFGLDPERVEGRDMLSLLFEEGEPQDRLAFLREGRRPGPDERWLEATARVGERSIPIEISVDAAKTSKGWTQVAFLRDISQRRAAEAALREARDRALAGERAKADFLAVMSHEMRTPLNGVLGTLELLRDTSLSRRQQELVTTMERSGQMILGLVEDLLDLAKFEAGKVEVEPRCFDLEALMGCVIDTVGGMADAAGLRLSWSRTVRVPDRLVADPRMLRHVLLNLVGNAIKFTPEGRVDVAVDLEGKDMLVIRVSDTGIGIAPEDRERIFGDFETADPSYARRHRGTGLGLGIARRIVDRMGGTIGVESEQGIGSTFWLRVPVGEAASALDGDAAPGRPLKILLVEDNEINRLVARDFLRSEGHEVIEARDGMEGLAQAESDAFDAILMDISMPLIDGPTAARQIRAGGGPSANAPIIGVTAHALPEEVEAFRAAGMDGCVTKPLDRGRLAEAVLRAARGAGASDPVCRTEMIGSMIATLGTDRTAQLIDALSRQMDRDLPALSDPARPVEQRGRLAHELAGAAASFGLMRLYTALCGVERTVKAEGRMPAERLAQLPGLWAGSRAALGQQVSRAA